MPINMIPPWLNIQPTDFLQATQQGTAAGINVAELRQRAAQQAAAIREAQARRAQEAWEAGERMRFAAQQAAENRVQRQEEAAALAEYRRGQLAMNTQRYGEDDLIDRERIAETMRHNKAMESISEQKAREAVERGDATIVQHPEAPGMLFLRNPSGAESVIERGDREPTQIQKDSMALRAWNMKKPGGMEDLVDPSGLKARQAYADDLLARYGAVAPNAGTNALGTNLTSGAMSPANDALRVQAHAAIAAGAPEAAVRARYKQMTGKELD